MKTKVNDENRVDYIMEYESGDISDIDMLHLFANLIETGMAWSLQGHYGRNAQAFIEQDWIDNKGIMNVGKIMEFKLDGEKRNV